MEKEEVTILGKKKGATVYEQLYQDCYAPMVLYADRCLNNRHQAEDIVQDVFSRVLQKGDELQLGSKARNLLFTMLRNQVIDSHRHLQRHHTQEVTDAIDEGSVEETIFEIELYERLYKAVEKLPKKNRRVMQMKLKGMSDHDIAEELGLSYETVRSHVKHGVASLKGDISQQLLLLLFLSL